MKVAVFLLVIFVLVGFAWECPSCFTENELSYCSECHLPQPPEGMVYVPATSVEIDGELVDVQPFFIDASPVTYREILPWLNGSGFAVEELGVIITGGGDESMQFFAFTPFTGAPTGGITVASQCLEHPVAAITCTGAQSYLIDTGKRLPTLAEMKVASSLGLIRTYDSYEAMSLYASHMQQSMGSMLGTLSLQAMFAGYSTENERIMWELTGSMVGGNPSSTILPLDSDYINIFKALDEPVISSTGSEMGYFNVIFRGAIEVPR